MTGWWTIERADDDIAKRDSGTKKQAEPNADYLTACGSGSPVPGWRLTVAVPVVGTAGSSPRLARSPVLAQ